MTAPRRRSFVCRDRSDAVRALMYLDGYAWDEPLQIVIEKYRPRRSLRANALYWQWCPLPEREIADAGQ